jgi:hypothetical protein
VIERVFVAGIPVRDELILELARLVDDAELADRLEDRYRREVKMMALDIADAKRSCGRSPTRRPGSKSSARCYSKRSNAGDGRGSRG